MQPDHNHIGTTGSTVCSQNSLAVSLAPLIGHTGQILVKTIALERSPRFTHSYAYRQKSGGIGKQYELLKTNQS